MNYHGTKRQRTAGSNNTALAHLISSDLYVDKPTLHLVHLLVRTSNEAGVTATPILMLLHALERGATVGSLQQTLTIPSTGEYETLLGALRGVYGLRQFLRENQQCQTSCGSVRFYCFYVSLRKSLAHEWTPEPHIARTTNQQTTVSKRYNRELNTRQRALPPQATGHGQ